MISMILMAMNGAQVANQYRVPLKQPKLPSRLPGRSPVKKVETEITILNRCGLDAQLAKLIVQAVNCFSSDVWIVKNGIEVDGKDRLGLLVLATKPGSKLWIRIEGSDAPEAMQKIERLIQWPDEESDRSEHKTSSTGFLRRKQNR